MPLWLTASPPFLVGPRAPQSPRATSWLSQFPSPTPTRHRTAASPVSFRVIVATFTRCELVLLALPRQYTVVGDRHGEDPVMDWPPGSHREPHHGACTSHALTGGSRAVRALCAPAWAGPVPHGPRQARPAWFCGRAAACRTRTMRVGHAPGLRPSYRF
jgi:hypothetical protein